MVKQEEYFKVQGLYEIILKCKQQFEVDYFVVQKMIVNMEFSFKRFVVVEKVRELDYECLRLSELVKEFVIYKSKVSLLEFILVFIKKDV